LWAIDEVWSPIAVRVMKVQEAAAISPERADELARMLALPDAREVSAEQMAYRRKVEKDIEPADPFEEERAA
jgi:hypothetical protein